LFVQWLCRDITPRESGNVPYVKHHAALMFAALREGEGNQGTEKDGFNIICYEFRGSAPKSRSSSFCYHGQNIIAQMATLS
jgi:hypothetical protein